MHAEKQQIATKYLRVIISNRIAQNYQIMKHDSSHQKPPWLNLEKYTHHQKQPKFNWLSRKNAFKTIYRIRIAGFCFWVCLRIVIHQTSNLH